MLLTQDRNDHRVAVSITDDGIKRATCEMNADNKLA